MQKLSFFQTLLQLARHIFSQGVQLPFPYAWQKRTFHRIENAPPGRQMLIDDIAVEFKNRNEHPYSDR